MRRGSRDSTCPPHEQALSILACCLLLALPLLLRLLPRAGAGAWRARVDVPLLLALGLGVTAVSADWLARFHLVGGPLSAVDFGQYCQAVGAAAAGADGSMNDQRSFFVARLLAPLARSVGVVDALTLGACAGLTAVVVGVALWAHAIAGRTAAIGAAILCGAVAPLVLLARNPTFYPEQHGAYAVASGAAAMALSTRRTGWIAVGAAAAAWAPWFDQRGVFWTVSCGGMVALAAVLPEPGPDGVGGESRISGFGRKVFGGEWPRRIGRSMLRLGLVAALLTGGWYGARPIWANGGALEPQVYAFAETVTRNSARGPDPQLVSRPCAAPPHFRWGWSSPLDLPRTIVCARAQVAAIPAAAAEVPSAKKGWLAQVEPWRTPLLIAAAIAATGLARRPWRLFLLLPPLVPCLAALDAARLEPDPRRLATIALFVPVVFGVAFAVLAEAGRAVEPARWGRLMRPVAALVLVLVVLGVIPTWLGPDAAWREPFRAQSEWEGVIARGGNRTSYDIGCQDAAARVPERRFGLYSARWRASSAQSRPAPTSPASGSGAPQR